MSAPETDPTQFVIAPARRKMRTMDAKPALAGNDAVEQARRPALELTVQTASSSYKHMLPPEVLGEALRTGVMPADFAPHIGTLLEEAPMTLLGKVVDQIHAATELPRPQIWNNMDKLAVEWKITRRFGTPAMLQDQQRKDAEDVRAGCRSARSLWAFQKGAWTASRSSSVGRLGTTAIQKTGRGRCPRAQGRG